MGKKKNMLGVINEGNIETEDIDDVELGKRVISQIAYFIRINSKILCVCNWGSKSVLLY